jgi:thymidylate synthase ThyX/thymidylate kinase
MDTSSHIAVGAGTFIVIEGTDSSQKRMHLKQLSDRLTAEGYEVALFDFPQHDLPSSSLVENYLNGSYGTAAEIGPYTGSLFYSLNRFEVGPRIQEALSQGKVVIANQFTGSSMVYHGLQLTRPEERRGFYIWLDNIEHGMLKVPRPTVNFVLRIPPEIMGESGDRSTILQSVTEAYDDLCELFPRDFLRVDCSRDTKLLDIDTVHEIIWQKIVPMLPTLKMEDKAVTSKKPVKTVVNNPYIFKNEDDTYTITDEGRAFLDEAVTNPTKNVYAFTQKLDTVTVAAAMARLSRRAEDMRITILDEFIDSIGKDEQLLQRIITAYGDDSVQQLTGIHIVVEKASNLLTKKLEWGRLAAYLEQSTRYIYFDKKDDYGNYRYFVPEHLKAETKKEYRLYMDRIFDLYAEMVHNLTTYLQTHSKVPKEEQDGAWKTAIKAQACDAARAVLPVATTATVGIYASGQALESLIMHLMSDPLPEARETGEMMLTEARKVAPAFLERADKPDRGGATIAYRAETFEAVDKLANEYLPVEHTALSSPVQLTDVWPRNELELVADMLYEHSDLSLTELRRIVSDWPYEQKVAVMHTYVGERLNRRQRPGRALEKAHYSWDLICDYGIFRDLQRHRMVDDLEWQPLTPRYGYDIPKLIEEAGLTDQFESCFDMSLRLYSILQSAGYQLEAQYTTLFGHRMRWKVTYNAREAFHFHELRTSPQGHPTYRKLVQQMHEKLCEVHPILGASMRFVNQGEDPELTRLAAERYTQYKLEQLKATTDALTKKARGEHTKLTLSD